MLDGCWTMHLAVVQYKSCQDVFRANCHESQRRNRLYVSKHPGKFPCLNQLWLAKTYTRIENDLHTSRKPNRETACELEGQHALQVDGMSLNVLILVI
jgi:hypothetical protein